PVILARYASTREGTPSFDTLHQTPKPSTPPSPAEAAAPPPPPPSEPVILDPSPADDASTLQDILTSPAAPHIDEHLGFLKELGLNYGWGPTAMQEWLLEHLHVVSGMPWWASIIAHALVYRLLLFPLFLRSSDAVARLTALNPVIKPLMKRATDAQMSGDQAEMAKARLELFQAYKVSGTKPWNTFVPMIAQLPFGYGNFKLYRAMGNLPVPGLETGGFLWVTDLTRVDPYFVMPVAFSVAMYYTAKRGSTSGEIPPTVSPVMLNVMMYALPVLGGAFMLTMPACLQLNFMISSFCGVGTSFILRIPSVRNFFRLQPFVKPQPAVDVAGARLNMAAQGEAARGMKYQAPSVKGSITVPGARVQPSIRSRQPSSPSSASPSSSQSNYTASSRSSQTSNTTTTSHPTGMRNPITFAKDVIQGGYKEVSGAFKEVKSQALQRMGQAQKKQAQGRTKAFEREAREYEERRQRELRGGKGGRERGGRR
ncbi:hypothetical protein LTS18_003680, partial [Coniosporium uncinatum]